MDSEFHKKKDGASSKCSLLLELAALDDLLCFKTEVEEKGFDVDKAGLWYCRRIGSKKMGFEERTPLMIASMFGSVGVLKYILGTERISVNRACGSDKATALHCAVAGGSGSLLEVVKLLLEASADADCVDWNGNKPVDVIAPSFKSNSCVSQRKAVESLLRGHKSVDGEAVELSFDSDAEEKVTSKKEYPVDILLPDINGAMFSSDEFRMYTFKVKPCSRAYSHDWTECPFVHPGENARRRDPRKYPYTCVPCPEFRKGGLCPKGDSCEFAHGVFESWLHPAQYRTRLCKDETGCSRKVCFFAHRPEELRPVYASTGSALPSPSSYSAAPLDMGPIAPMSLGSPAATSTASMSPLAAPSQSPTSVNLWQNKVKLTPPALQLPGSRLKTALSARDLDHEMGLKEEICRLSSSPSRFARTGDLKPANLDDIFRSIDSPMMSQLQGMSVKPSTPTRLQSPTGLQIRRSSYPSNNIPSSPVRNTSPPLGFDSSSAVATAVMNSRSAAMAKRSHSFIDRGAMTQSSVSAPIRPSNLSDWASPDGKLDWGIHGDELNKLRKSASFGFRSNSNTAAASTGHAAINEPDVSWVNTLVKDVSPAEVGAFGVQNQRYTSRSKGARPMFSPWGEQLYIEPEQLVA